MASHFYCDGTRTRTRLRGVAHEATLVVIPVLSYALLADPRLTSERARSAAVVYLFSWLWCKAASSQYHRRHWRSRVAENRANAADHAGIFWMIAGSMTPLAVCLLERTRTFTLAALWLGCAAGTVWALVWRRPGLAHWVQTLVYVGFGCCVAPALPELAERLSGSDATLALAVVVQYLIGALVYALNWPDPWPQTFGFHEVFHALVSSAAFTTYVINRRVLLRDQA